MLLTLGAHAQRGLRYLVCVSVCLCVCVSVTQHLTFHVIIRATNDTNLLSVTCWYGYMISWPFFTPRKTRMRMNLDHVANGHFVLGRDVLCEFDYWPLAVSLQQRYARCPLLIRFHPTGTAAPRVWHSSAFHYICASLL